MAKQRTVSNPARNFGIVILDLGDVTTSTSAHASRLGSVPS